MQSFLRFLARPGDAPRSAPVTSEPSIVLHIGPVYWTVRGFGWALSCLAVVLAGLFVCGVLTALVVSVRLIF